MTVQANIIGTDADLRTGEARTISWELEAEPGEADWSLDGTITVEFRDSGGSVVVTWTSASAPIVITSAAARMWEWQLSSANVATLYGAGPSPRDLTYTQTYSRTGVEPVVISEGAVRVRA